MKHIGRCLCSLQKHSIDLSLNIMCFVVPLESVFITVLPKIFFCLKKFHKSGSHKISRVELRQLGEWFCVYRSQREAITPNVSGALHYNCRVDPTKTSRTLENKFNTLRNRPKIWCIKIYKEKSIDWINIINRLICLTHVILLLQFTFF